MSPSKRRLLAEAIAEPMTPALVAQYLAAIGSRGGKAKSAAKTLAARANAKKKRGKRKEKE